MDDIKEIKQDLKEIRRVLQDNTVRMAEYNAQLSIHIAGVRDLQDRVKPIEDHVHFLRSIGWFVAKAVVGIAALMALLNSTKSLFFKDNIGNSGSHTAQYKHKYWVSQ